MKLSCYLPNTELQLEKEAALRLALKLRSGVSKTFWSSVLLYLSWFILKSRMLIPSSF